MPEAFVALDAFLRPSASVAQPVIVPAPTPVVEPCIACEELGDTLGRIRRFRAAVADALELATGQLLEDIAADVIARELRIAPADIVAVVTVALARLDAEERVRVRVHPAEVPACSGLDVSVVGDASLRRGDAMLEVASGTIDLTLGARLETVLARCAVR